MEPHSNNKIIDHSIIGKIEAGHNNNSGEILKGDRDFKTSDNNGTDAYVDHIHSINVQRETSFVISAT